MGKHKLCTIWLLGTLLSVVATPASAQWTTLTLPVSGSTLIGMRSDGYAVVETCTSGGQVAALAFIGTTPGVGLTGNWVVRAASGNDNIGLVNGTITNACGHTFDRLIFNGYWLDIEGRGGADVVSGGDQMSIDNNVLGGSGNDYLFVGPGGVADGENGSDRVYGWGFSELDTERLYGGRNDEGSDRVCEWSNNVIVYELDGGPGYDWRCGKGSHFYTNFESSNCTAACTQ